MLSKKRTRASNDVIYSPSYVLFQFACQSYWVRLKWSTSMFRIRLIIQGINRGKLLFGDEWKTHGFDSSFSYWLNFLCQIIHTLFIDWSEFLMRICETSFYGILCCWSKESLGTVSLTADKTAFLSWLNIRRKLDDAYADLDESISLLIDRNQISWFF